MQTLLSILSAGSHTQVIELLMQHCSDSVSCRSSTVEVIALSTQYCQYVSAGRLHCSDGTLLCAVMLIHILMSPGVSVTVYKFNIVRGTL